MAAGFRVFRTLGDADGAFGPAALTIGNFDGVHAGHTRILRRVCDVARVKGWKPSALTFDPHPTKIVAPARAPRLLTTPEQRCRLMEEEGIAQVLILPFTRELSHLTPEQFVRSVLVEALDAKAVFVGANFRFGHKHAGDTHLLQKLGEQLGFGVEVIPSVTIRGVAVSSSEIRRLIEEGNVSRAARLLERPYALEGAVVRGHGVGAKQTVPTLNLSTPAETLPAHGVYITKTHAADGTRWPSVTNVGYRPTFGGDALSIETFLLEPLEGATPAHIRVEFLRRLRGEKKFPSAEELKAQILRDVRRAQAYFRRVPCHTKKV
jgi:riboflavin kinase/FMN adenylyltransferase